MFDGDVPGGSGPGGERMERAKKLAKQIVDAFPDEDSLVRDARKKQKVVNIQQRESDDEVRARVQKTMKTMRRFAKIHSKHELEDLLEDWADYKEDITGAEILPIAQEYLDRIK